VVSPGESLEEIARRAGVPVEDVAELNGLAPGERVLPGRMIFVLDSSTAWSAGATAEALGADAPMPPTVIGAGARAQFRWPLATVRIVIGSPFGTRDGRPHEGIDLPAPVGTPVFAAGDGQVAYAGNGVRGYGNLVVIKHPGDLLTVYAHNSLLMVTQGQPVRAGDRIALVGQSGRATGPHLHFEVRTGQIPRNPMSFLPDVPRGST
jgi:murein DD-endopeptidase MepM/ murein hydrolase activator NlpD